MPPVLTQQGVMHTVTGLADPMLGGGAKGCCCPEPAQNTTITQDHTADGISNTWDTKEKKNCNSSHQLEVTFSRLEAVGQGLYQASGSLAEDSSSSSIPFRWPASAPAKNHSVIYSCLMHFSYQQEWSPASPKPDWDHSPQSHKHQQYSAHDLGGTHTLFALVRAWNDSLELPQDRDWIQSDTTPPYLRS